MYFFSNVSPRKMSWQNNDLMSHEAIRVLALPSAAAETTEPTPRSVFYFPHYLPQHWAVFYTSTKLKEALYQFYMKRVNTSLFDESHVLLYDAVSFGILRRFEWPLCSYFQGVSLLLNQRRQNVQHLPTLECHLSHYLLSVDVECPPFTVTRTPSFALFTQRRCRMSSIYCH
jgi:hypothetical protein